MKSRNILSVRGSNKGFTIKKWEKISTPTNNFDHPRLFSNLEDDIVNSSKFQAKHFCLNSIGFLGNVTLFLPAGTLPVKEQTKQNLTTMFIIFCKSLISNFKDI